MRSDAWIILDSCAGGSTAIWPPLQEVQHLREMILGLGILFLLLYDTALANVCMNEVHNSPDKPIIAISQVYENSGQSNCQYFIQAPAAHYIALNFTNIYGFRQQKDRTGVSDRAKNSNTNCIPPKVEIVEVTSIGREDTMDIICAKRNNFLPPQVFQSNTNLVKLTYSWLPGQYSGFSLSFDFYKLTSICEFRCGDSSCLPDASLVCNGVAECLDHSDEFGCDRTVTEAQSSSNTSRFIQVIVIVIAVVFTLGVIVCVFSHYRLSSRLWRERPHSNSNSAEHNQLQPQSSQHHSTEVVYVPNLSQERCEREMAMENERQILRHSVRQDMALNLPPSIPISDDGEEGYARSQRELQQTCDLFGEVDREAVHPPPNRTIYQGESPPPYRTYSLGGQDRPPKIPNRTVHDCHESQSRSRCYSMNNNSHTRNWNLNLSSMPSNTDWTTFDQPSCHSNVCPHPMWRPGDLSVCPGTTAHLRTPRFSQPHSVRHTCHSWPASAPDTSNCVNQNSNTGGESADCDCGQLPDYSAVMEELCLQDEQEQEKQRKPNSNL